MYEICELLYQKFTLFKIHYIEEHGLFSLIKSKSQFIPEFFWILEAGSPSDTASSSDSVSSKFSGSSSMISSSSSSRSPPTWLAEYNTLPLEVSDREDEDLLTSNESLQ